MDSTWFSRWEEARLGGLNGQHVVQPLGGGTPGGLNGQHVVQPLGGGTPGGLNGQHVVQPLGGGTPGGLNGQHVVQLVLGVRQDPLQPFHSNTSVDGIWCCCLSPHDLCRCPCNLVQSLRVCLLGVAEVAHLIVEHGTLDDCLVEANQDILVNLELFQLSDKVHALVRFLAACLNVWRPV